MNTPKDLVSHIYCDGSSYSHPRKGGIGIKYIFIDSEGVEALIKSSSYSGYRGATNNQMELMACIIALEDVIRHDLFPRVSKIIVSTDSRYVVDNYKNAMFTWPKAKWLKREGGPVLNADLWKDLIRNMKKARMWVEFQWVKGHAHNEHNKDADKLAKESAKSPSSKTLTHVTVRRKISTKSVEIGSVPMLGQRITIRIITSEHLKVQGVWKLKYEIPSKKSKYYNNVDIIFSPDLLSPGHTYLVRLNKEQNNPRIVKAIKEITKKK